MILDDQNIYSDDQVVTVTADSTNVIDHGPGTTGPYGADGQIVAQVSKVAMTAGGTSLIAHLEQSTVEAMTSPDILSVGPTVVAADLILGKEVLNVRQPRITKQFTQIVYTCSGTFSGGGAITAGYTPAARREEPQTT
jgi:hypothetical protein